jgi:ribosomal protein L37AE/L43A
MMRCPKCGSRLYVRGHIEAPIIECLTCHFELAGTGITQKLIKRCLTNTDTAKETTDASSKST